MATRTKKKSVYVLRGGMIYNFNIIIKVHKTNVYDLSVPSLT